MIAQVDLENQFGKRRVQEWSDDAGTGLSRAEHVQMALDAAEGEYVIYLPLPDPLTKIAKWQLGTLAGYRLASRRETPEKLEVLRMQYEDVIAQLKAGRKNMNDLAPALSSPLTAYQVEAPTEFPE